MGGGYWNSSSRLAGASLTEQQILAIDLTEPTSDANRRQRIEVVRALADVPLDSPATRLVLHLLRQDDSLVNLNALKVLKQRTDIVKNLFGEFLILLRELSGGWKRGRLCEILTGAGVQRPEFLAALEAIGNKEESVARAIWKITGRIDAIKRILDELLEEPREETCDLICEIGPDASFTAPALVR